MSYRGADFLLSLYPLVYYSLFIVLQPNNRAKKFFKTTKKKEILTRDFKRFVI